MFDLFGIIDFQKKLKLEEIKNPFANYHYYDSIPFKEHSVRTSCAKIFYLERNETSDNYYFHNDVHLFIFGYVFSNTNYEALEGNTLKKLSAKDVYDLYNKYNTECISFIKGSFVIVIYNQKENIVLCMSDQLNVFPLFYAFKNGIFILSSSVKAIVDSGLISVTINKAAIVEFAIFDYILGNKTYYKDIKMLDYGKILTVEEKGISETRYFSIDSLFQRRLLKKDDALAAIGELMHKNIDLYTSDANKFLLSLTGGFDGRTNLALVDRPADDFLCYSYGTRKSNQISIPEEIAQKLKINYKPIYLDNDFEEHFEEYGLKALFFSDGTAPILRANFPYCYQHLYQFSNIIITGLFGSEILRPMYNIGVQFNDNAERIFLGNNFEKDFSFSFEHEKKRAYFRAELFDECYDEIRNLVIDNYLAKYQQYDKLTRFFFFYIGEGIRKYFMQEIRIERPLVTTRFPYFDFDFVTLMYKTSFAGIYNGALKRSPFKRRKAQLLYAYVMNKYRPMLGEILTDRGYRPKDLLSPLSYLKIIPGYIKAMNSIRKTGNNTYDAERVTNLLFLKKQKLMRESTEIFPGTMMEKYNNKENIKDNYRFSRVFSLKYWFQGTL
jgi:Glutamine amidotransferase domain